MQELGAFPTVMRCKQIFCMDQKALEKLWRKDYAPTVAGPARAAAADDDEDATVAAAVTEREKGYKKPTGVESPTALRVLAAQSLVLRSFLLTKVPQNLVPHVLSSVAVSVFNQKVTMAQVQAALTGSKEAEGQAKVLGTRLADPSIIPYVKDAFARACGTVIPGPEERANLFQMVVNDVKSAGVEIWGTSFWHWKALLSRGPAYVDLVWEVIAKARETTIQVVDPRGVVTVKPRKPEPKVASNECAGLFHMFTVGYNVEDLLPHVTPYLTNKIFGLAQIKDSMLLQSRRADTMAAMCEQALLAVNEELSLLNASHYDGWGREHYKLQEAAIRSQPQTLVRVCSPDVSHDVSLHWLPTTPSPVCSTFSVGRSPRPTCPTRSARPRTRAWAPPSSSWSRRPSKSCRRRCRRRARPRAR
jgi:hypothetical protein